MPVSNSRSKSLRATICSFFPSSQDAGSSSTKGSQAFASSRLWELLQRRSDTKRKVLHNDVNASDVDDIGIAVEWPVDRRLKSHGKRKTLIVWVKAAEVSSI